LPPAVSALDRNENGMASHLVFYENIDLTLGATISL
jgi:hypothetical protein